MVGRYAAFQASLAQSVGHIVERALTPSERVARHWESTEKLTWFGAGADHSKQHVSWSFGQLKGLPVVEGQRHTVGVFHLTKAAFPGLDDQALREQLEALIPTATDGATRVFLQRVSSQLAMAEALRGVAARVGCEVSLFARPDALDTPAATPRWPEHARDRVAAALAQMDDDLRLRLEALWGAEPKVLLDALPRA